MDTAGASSVAAPFELLNDLTEGVLQEACPGLTIPSSSGFGTMFPWEGLPLLSPRSPARAVPDYRYAPRRYLGGKATRASP